jgi:hypothetical protein
MKNQALLVLLVVLMITVLSASKSSDQTFDKITVREFELVDSKGKPRVSIRTEDDGSVVFRLKDAEGTIRVKLAADEEGSGLVLLDGETNVGIHALVKKDGGSVKVVGKDGKERKL